MEARKMTQSYRDEILDLLADGNARTVEEIREAIGATQGARIHQVMAELVTHTAIHRELYPVKKTKMGGLFYYRREGIEATTQRQLSNNLATTIATNLPAPERPARSPWPWRKLEIGQSFLIKGRKLQYVRTLAAHNGRRTGFKYRCAGDVTGVRVWRIS